MFAREICVPVLLILNSTGASDLYEEQERIIGISKNLRVLDYVLSLNSIPHLVWF